MDNSNTKGGRGEAATVVVVDGRVTEHFSPEEFEMVLVHHFEHRVREAHDVHTTRYSLPGRPDRFLFVSNDDATMVAVAFEEDIGRLLERLVGRGRLH